MNKYQRLVALLIKRTKAGSAHWEPTAGQGMFALSLPDYSVRISKVENEQEDGIDDVFFQIVNSNGAVIDSFRDVDVVLENELTYRDMESLYENARRIAFGVDQALDKLLEELDKA
jgi:hypothetical protein